MSIELTCLGGAAAWPNPGQGCSSYLVRSGETTILLDAGSDTFMELRKHADYRELDAACNTPVLPAEDRYNVTFEPPRPPGPCAGRLAFAGGPPAAAAASARSTRRSNSRRLNSSVSASWDAW